MNIADEHTRAIQSLGYSVDEAGFLRIVITHSGYFAPRQFLAFSGSHGGKHAHQFTRKLESRGHATWREYHDLGSVYHLFSKTLYRQIDREDLRNHRRHAPEFIRSRLLQLDFVLANLSHEYLETEHDKVHFFSNELGVPQDALPVRAYEGNLNAQPTLRYFADKFPLFLERTPASLAPEVTLSYVDRGQAHLDGFARHLNAYTPLFRHLPAFRFLYIASSTVHFARAQQCFSTLVEAPRQQAFPKELERYFRLRTAWDGKQYGTLSSDDIEWLDQASQRLGDARVENLYAVWAAGGDWEKPLTDHATAGAVEFRTHLVTVHKQSRENELRRAGGKNLVRRSRIRESPAGRGAAPGQPGKPL
jgi:hypothetical protein